MPGLATIAIRPVVAAQQPKVNDLEAHIAANMPGFQLTGSARQGEVVVRGPSDSYQETVALCQALANVVPPVWHPLDEPLAIPNVGPDKFYIRYDPEGGGPPQEGRLIA
jgi:hypothetical protein